VICGGGGKRRDVRIQLLVDSGRYPSIFDVMRDRYGITGVRNATTTLASVHASSASITPLPTPKSGRRFTIRPRYPYLRMNLNTTIHASALGASRSPPTRPASASRSPAQPTRRLPTLADRSGSRRLRRSVSALHARHRPRRPSGAPALPRVGARARVDSDVPRNLSVDRLEDPHGFRSTDHLERRPVPHRTVHELRRGGSSAGSPCGACTTTGEKRGHVHSLTKHGPVSA
jgi:hypothetical protein